MAFCRWAARLGLTRREAADRLGLVPRTVQLWVAAWEKDRLRVHTRGRRAQRSDRRLRNRALALIGLLGPRVGVPTLQALCPGMARRELQDLLRRYRRVWRRKHRLLLRTLHWKRTGSVWAVDFSEPPLPIEGRYTWLLAVRDLASGCQLLWLPTLDESAKTAIDALESLFRQHGAPLVLKSDNGSAFIAKDTDDLSKEWCVRQLFSPPRTPSYNGSAEAGIGSMRTRTHHQAARHGRAGEWTCNDVEAARLEANETARPWGHHGPTPDEVWQGRALIGIEERMAFMETAQRLEQETRAEQGYATDAQLDRTAQAAVNRVALRRALVAHGLLTFTSNHM